MNLVVNLPPVKKPYAAPVLVVHGDLRTLTQAGSTNSGEPGNCKGGGNPLCVNAKS
jgi:hypothetical protein